MEIKNLLSKNTQQALSTAGEGIKKKFKPVIDVAQEAGTAIKQEFAPVAENISNVATNIAKPIVEPIQQAQQKSQAIGEINTFFSDAGITLDDIKALAEDEGIDPNEVITKFQRNGIKVQGMEEMQAQEQVAEQANKPFQLDVAPEYDEVTALSKLTGAIPKYEYSPEDSTLKSTGKMIGNLPASALQMAGGVGDIGLSYLRNLDQGPLDAFTETAKAKIINPAIGQVQGVAQTAKEGYQKGLETPYSITEGGVAKKRGTFGGVLGATEALTQQGTEFVVENPVGAIMTGKSIGGVKRGGQALKTAGQEAMKGNIGKATTGLVKSTGVGLKENIYDPIKMGVTAPITAVKLGAKGASAIAKKTGIKTPEKVQNISNNMAERMLSSQWKLTKPIRKELEGKIGQSGPKFALENNLVGKDIESTADNAGVFKIDKIKEKIEAVKKFGQTETPSVAKNVAQVLKSDIESSVQKSYGKGNTQKVLDENHPELASVYKLADEIVKSDKIDFVKLEQLKELHDYLNPENIQYDISGKPISETRNILSAGKRQKLQQILEAEGQKRGIDIKKINKDIQGAYTLEKGLNDTVGRIANLNILGLGDTQTAVISSILGGAPGAVGGILLKKGLTSEGFVGGLAKSLYSKKDATTNNSNPSGAMTPSVTRLGRIMNNSSDTVTPKVEPKGVTPKPKTEGVKPKTTQKPLSTAPVKQEKGVVVPKSTENTPIVKKEGMNIGKYKSSEVLPTNNADFSQRFIPETKIDEKTTKMATIQILDKKGKVIDEFSFSRRPSSERQIQDMADALIREKVLGKYFNSKEFDSSLKEFKNLPVNTSSPKTLVKPSPKPIVKNLQKTEKSATIGDMETKKLDRLKNADAIANEIKRLGYRVDQSASKTFGSKSEYITVFKGDEQFKIRVSDHELPPSYGGIRGNNFADMEIGPHASNTAKGLIERIEKKLGKPIDTKKAKLNAESLTKEFGIKIEKDIEEYLSDYIKSSDEKIIKKFKDKGWTEHKAYGGDIFFSKRI